MKTTTDGPAAPKPAACYPLSDEELEAQLTDAIIPRPDSVTEPGSGTLDLEALEPAASPKSVVSSNAGAKTRTNSEPAEISRYKRGVLEYEKAVELVRGQGDGWRGAADVVKVTRDLRSEALGLEHREQVAIAMHALSGLGTEELEPVLFKVGQQAGFEAVESLYNRLRVRREEVEWKAKQAAR